MACEKLHLTVFGKLCEKSIFHSQLPQKCARISLGNFSDIRPVADPSFGPSGSRLSQEAINWDIQF